MRLLCIAGASVLLAFALCGCSTGDPARDRDDDTAAGKQNADINPADFKRLYELLAVFETTDAHKWKSAANEIRTKLKVPLSDQMKALLTDIESSDTDKVMAAQARLAEMSRKCRLLGKLDTRDYLAWMLAAEELLKMGSEASEQLVMALICKFESGDAQLHEWSRELLCRMGERSVEPLVSVIEYEKSGYDVKRECFRALVLIDPQGRARVSGMVNHADVRVRRALAVALGMGDEAFAMQLLKSLCADPDWEVRDRAAQSLGNLGSPNALPILLAQLSDGDQHVRCAAVMSLGMIKDSGAVGALVKLLNNELSEHLRKLAAQSLRQITGLDYGNDPEKWRQWWESSRR